jgi:uncharacterized protein (DUF1501 family)
MLIPRTVAYSEVVVIVVVCSFVVVVVERRVQWGGNAVLMGGAIRGAQILGRYPDDLRANSPFVYKGGQGQLLPTSSWESVWQPIAQWLGVPAAAMTEVLPNAANFPDQDKLQQEQLFR